MSRIFEEMATLPALTELSPEQLEAWLTERGQPAYRARQIRRALVAGRPFESMDDLPRDVRRSLHETFRPSSLSTVRRWEADGGLTTKRLYQLDGGHTVEAVLMRYARRATLCISSQVGCPIRCPFCATGQGPFGRNLRAHEILDQAIEAHHELTGEDRRLSHVVFMGMGEPLANYDAVLDAVRRITDTAWLGISPRRVVVSTSGLVPMIDRLGQEGLPLTLAVSLHAARDALRDELVPLNRRYPLSELIPAARRFASRTGRRISYEWVLLAGVNDTDRDAEELASLVDHPLAHVNVIPFNPVPGTPYQEPDARSMSRFVRLLTDAGVTVTIRDTRGRDTDAACGQLRARALEDGATAG
ncbi:MAG TPA: 23S rRNA (adenine(2503)-C(2))-methyltransferase RlmN [Candidatus Binatia bacterium]|nr:23S rRNA (adenine(2503)-C(2))-methyltransferase RlmN [Candidatus Binatia bacterium]